MTFLIAEDNSTVETSEQLFHSDVRERHRKKPNKKTLRERNQNRIETGLCVYRGLEQPD